MIIDELYEKVRTKSPLCVGLDLRLSYIPAEIKEKYESDEDRLFEFAKTVTEATKSVAACYKVQIACYEALGLAGLRAYSRILNYLRESGEIVIADIKRGDIASTAEEYAKGHFTGDFQSDMVTLNPYMGLDAVSPYFPYFKDSEKGCFVLVKTSNPSSEDFEEIQNEKGEPLYMSVLEKIKDWGKDFCGNSGYSAIGAVVGVNHLSQIQMVRQAAKGKVFLLVPGFGAQGAKAEDIAMLIGGEMGGVVNVSRGIIACHIGKEGTPADLIAEKAQSMAKELINACKAV